MPVFLAALLGGLVSATSSIVGRVLIALGVGYVTYQGIDVALDVAKVAAFGALGTIAGFNQAAGILGLLNIGAAFNILFSAIAARFVVMGLSSGAITRMVIK